MATRVFVKQRVEEQNSAFRNRAMLADECDFAKAQHAFVGRKQSFKRIVTNFRRVVHHFAVFEGNFEVVDNVAVVDKGQRVDNRTVDLFVVRRGKDFFRGHVGGKWQSVLSFFFGGKPHVVKGKTDGQVGAFLVAHVDVLEVVVVEELGATV